MEKVLSALFAELTSIKPKSLVNGIPSVLRPIDQLLNGFKPKYLYALVGKRNSFKTALAMNICFNASIFCKFPTRFLSLDAIGDKSLTKLAIFQQTNINLKENNFDLMQMQKIYKVGEAIKRSNFKILCNRKLKHIDIEEICKGVGKGLVVIDYLELMDGFRQDNLKFLKEVAEKYNTAVIIISENKDTLFRSFYIKNMVDYVLNVSSDVCLDVFEDTDERMQAYIELELLGEKQKEKIFFNEYSRKFFNSESELMDDMSLNETF